MYLVKVLLKLIPAQPLAFRRWGHLVPFVDSKYVNKFYDQLRALIIVENAKISETIQAGTI